MKSTIQSGTIVATDEEAIATVKQGVTIEKECLSPVPDSDDEEEKENRKRKRLENLEKARKTKKMRALSKPRTKGKSAAARVYKESQALSNLDTQAVLDQLDHYLNTYPKPGIWVQG